MGEAPHTASQGVRVLPQRRRCEPSRTLITVRCYANKLVNILCLNQAATHKSEGAMQGCNQNQKIHQYRI